MRIVLAVLALAPLTGCTVGGSCASSFGPTGITMTFTVADPGAYTWTIASDSASTDCQADLPDGLPSCTGDVFGGTPTADATDDGGATVETTLLTDTSDTVHVTIARDGTSLVDEDVTPTWEEPDPEHCPDTAQATQTYDLTTAG